MRAGHMRIESRATPDDINDISAQSAIVNSASLDRLCSTSPTLASFRMIVPIADHLNIAFITKPVIMIPSIAAIGAGQNPAIT